MEDLVRIGVADAAQQARIGERALERVVLAHERVAEAREVRLERFEPARIHLRERRLPLHEVKARALLRARLGEQQRARRKIDRRKADLRRDLLAARAETEAAGDHEVHDEEQVPVEREDDPFSEPPQPDQQQDQQRDQQQDQDPRPDPKQEPDRNQTSAQAERRLQQIRDREAERRREREKAQQARPDPVDKDW